MSSFFGKIFSILRHPKKEPTGKYEQEKREEVYRKPTQKIRGPVTQKSLYLEEQLERLKEAELLEARAKAKEIILEARDEAFKIEKSAEEETRKVRNEIYSLESRIAQKEESIDRKNSAIEEKGKIFEEKELEYKNKIAEIEKIKQEQLAKLERAAGLTKDEAKKLILEAMNLRLKEDKSKIIKEIESEAREEANKKAKQILVDVIQKSATDYVAEYTVSTVKINDEDMKGRIIGKEGRNIRAFEQATGVDVDLDEEGVIRLSSFDPIRREIARIALEKLMSDGRVQPARIEELVQRVKSDLEKTMFEEGEKLCHEVKVYNLPPEIISLLGRFKYRFSYGQNLIAHTMEETKIGINLASEVGADVNTVRIGCLLHDIGKVITDEEGTHVKLGVDLLRKHNMPEEIINCVAEHHEDQPFSSIESTLVYVADAISGSRPGARFENYEEYVKRLRELEDLAKSFKGVKDVYAFQAGREVRVIVSPEEVDDAGAIMISHELKDKIEKTIKNFPGQIKITVIRELRAIDTAK